jgi:hypothetical protein
MTLQTFFKFFMIGLVSLRQSGAATMGANSADFDRGQAAGACRSGLVIRDRGRNLPHDEVLRKQIPSDPDEIHRSLEVDVLQLLIHQRDLVRRAEECGEVRHRQLSEVIQLAAAKPLLSRIFPRQRGRSYMISG